MIQQKHLDVLLELGTDTVDHHKDSFFNHLKGTCDLLESWGNDEAVCLAGLFHSIYGTQNFLQQTLTYDMRDKIRHLIGEESEQLVYLFSVCDRQTYFANFPALASGAPLVIYDKVNEKNMRVDKPTLIKLMELEMANLLDQAPEPEKLYPDAKASMSAICKCVRGLVSDACVDAVEAYLALADKQVAA